MGNVRIARVGGGGGADPTRIPIDSADAYYDTLHFYMDTTKLVQGYSYELIFSGRETVPTFSYKAIYMMATVLFKIGKVSFNGNQLHVYGFAYWTSVANDNEDTVYNRDAGEYSTHVVIEDDGTIRVSLFSNVGPRELKTYETLDGFVRRVPQQADPLN